MNRDHRIALDWLRSETGDGLGAPPRVIAALDRIYAKKPRKPSTAKAPGRTKAERDEQRSAVTAQLRAIVFARAGYRCECCRSRTPAELHHLVSGGSRRHQESPATCAAVCVFCHGDLHKNREHALLAMRQWATELGYLAALKAINHRIDKLREAQRARTA